MLEACLVGQDNAVGSLLASLGAVGRSYEGCWFRGLRVKEKGEVYKMGVESERELA